MLASDINDDQKIQKENNMQKKHFDPYIMVTITLFGLFLSSIFLYDTLKDIVLTRTTIATHANTIPHKNNSKKHLIISPDGTLCSSTLNEDINDKEEIANPDVAIHPVDPYKHIFFTPDDQVCESLITFIEKEHKKIEIAVFAFTNTAIAHALINAHNRGTIVELVTDPSTMKDRNNKSSLLVNSGIKAYIYNPENGKKGLSSAMHHKFMIFHGTGVVWTGSCNFTRAGVESNQENVVLLHGNQYVRIFSKQFNKLKKRSYQFYSPPSDN